MFSSKVIELEEQFNCSQHHNQPILMVLLDKQVKREERLLCPTFTENLKAETNMIGLKKVLQMIQENQKYKVENFQGLIKVDVNLVEQFVNELHKLKSKIILQFDELITNSHSEQSVLMALDKVNQYIVSSMNQIELLIVK